MSKTSPLWQEMYFRDSNRELTRAIGYDDLPLADAMLQALAAKYGEEIMTARDEIIRVDTDATTRSPFPVP